MKLTKIPRNIFQTWQTKNISDNFKKLSETWIEKNPNYSYFLFDDNDCKEFIKKHFEINVYLAYCRVIPGAFKADFWRYCVLYIYGGVYVDIDTICHNEIDLFLNDDIEFMTPIDLNNGFDMGTYNLFNAFIASVPKHPILLNCINLVVYNIENNLIPKSNLDFTGPGILGKATNKYLNLNEESSFVGKQGFHDNYKIKFLHFEYISEYVKDNNNNILFQNKNGNPLITEIYNNEIKNTNYIDWGKCKSPIKKFPTIITMIYNIREKENNDSNCNLNHNIEKYFESAKKFILKLPYPLVIFTDDNKLMNIIQKERTENLEKTFIYIKPFEDTYFYKDLSRLQELQDKFHILNGDIQHETPHYIILNNNKFDCIDEATELNPFDSTHFLWMDFGINHVAETTERIHEWIFDIPDKIKQLCINPYTENTSQKEHFQLIYHNMAGGLFSGSKNNIKKYSELFKQKTEQIYNEEWYQIDEAVMTMVQRENPDLFDLFYGDYQGIVCNYVYPIHNIDLILRGSQKCLDYNRIKEAFDILVYCLKYFEINPNCIHFYNFIQQNIITNYFFNNKLLLDEVIKLINSKKQSTNIQDIQQINSLLENNKVNIEFYQNKEKIL